MRGNAWFMSVDVDRAGRTLAWRYPVGVTERDLLFMERVTEVMPRIAATLGGPTERPGDQTQWLSRRWFEQ